MQAVTSSATSPAIRWRASVLAAAGNTDAAKSAEARAAAEIDHKAVKLRDPELRRMFLLSRQRASL